MGANLKFTSWEEANKILYEQLKNTPPSAIITNPRIAEIVREEIDKMFKTKGIIITVPKSIKWEDYEKELKAVEDYSQVMNYKVPTIPKDIDDIKRCYVVYDGFIRGWQEVVGHETGKEFDCTTTGKNWKGNFIQRSGPFHKIEPIPMKGFMGWRYYYY